MTGKQWSQQQSKMDNRGIRYTNVGTVYNGPVNHQTIVNDKMVTYEVDHQDVEALERFSMWVMQHVGEKRAKLIAVLTALLGGGGIVSTASGASLPINVVQPVLFTSLALLFMTAAMIAALKFRADSRCTKCDQFYAMVEIGDPVVTEVERRGGIQETTKRHYECRYCKDEVTVTSTSFIADEPEDES